MREQKLWIALPDTLLLDNRHLREKTIKLGMVARSSSIFRVQKIFIYRDRTKRFGEASLIKMILEYLDTPQYLRRQMYGKRTELRYAGLLPPLRTPHHKLVKKPSEIKVGEYREGFVIRKEGVLHVDVGLPILIPLEGCGSEGSRVTLRFKSTYPHLKCESVMREDVDGYWGYEVKESDSLIRLLKNTNPEVVIFTSCKGKPIENIWQDLLSVIKSSQSIMLIFGSPRAGVYEILSKEGLRPDDVSSYVVNLFPKQGVFTIRTEEALLGTLAIFNLGRFL